MAQIITQSVDTDVVVILTDTDNVAVEDLVYTDLTAQFKREGETSFNSKVLTGSNFEEVSDGVYIITFTAAQVNLVGSFVVRVTGADIQPFVTIANIVASAETAPGVSLVTSTMIGQLADLAGNPVKNSAVSVRVLGKPSLESNVALSDDLLTVKTDNNGEFAMNLVVLADVEVFIPQVNFRRRFVVPNIATFNLFTDL